MNRKEEAKFLRKLADILTDIHNDVSILLPLIESFKSSLSGTLCEKVNEFKTAQKLYSKIFGDKE